LKQYLNRVFHNTNERLCVYAPGMTGREPDA
jgi:hypothetical protein